MADDKPTGEGLLVEARERFEESLDGSDFNRKTYEDDVRFSRMADQWPNHIKKQREEEGRPCLTINRLPSFIRQVVNESRQNKPGIKVTPVDNAADEDTAEVIAGLIRSIERNGDGAEVAYDTAIDQAVSGGFGFFQISIDYAHQDSFDLECRIDRIANALMVNWDVSSTAFDASDWMYAFVSDWLTEDEFEFKYPKAKKVSFEGDSRDQVQRWLSDDKVRVASYWTREEKSRKLFLMDDGTVFREDGFLMIAQRLAQSGGIDLGNITEDEARAAYQQLTGTNVLRTRDSAFYEVKRRTINGVEILEEDDWPGQYIPICPVWGEEVIIDGRRNFRSMIRDARDPQAMFNFWRSASTELVALAPRAPWVGPVGFVPKGHEEKWASANTRSHAYLEYDPKYGAPQRQPFAGVPGGALQEALNASDDIKAVTGMYDASLGARSNETSGRAILARQREGDVANFHFIDNLSRAIRYAGKVLVDIIPSVYSPRETIRILGEDMREKVVRLVQEDGGSMQPGIDGQERLYNLAVGKYDVEVSSGPSFATQREETRETLIELMRAVPQAAPFIGDVLLDHMDFVGADKVAKRLQMLLPPAVQQMEGITPPQQAPGPAQPAPGVQPPMPQAGDGGFGTP